MCGMVSLSQMHADEMEEAWADIEEEPVQATSPAANVHTQSGLLDNLSPIHDLVEKDRGLDLSRDAREQAGDLSPREEQEDVEETGKRSDKIEEEEFASDDQEIGIEEKEEESREIKDESECLDGAKGVAEETSLEESKHVDKKKNGTRKRSWPLWTVIGLHFAFIVLLIFFHFVPPGSLAWGRRS
jgi:hypothetical protein